MMQLPCEIVQDLILLYVDDACSPGSRKAVEEHLARCSACRQRLQALQQPDIAVQVNSEPEPVVQERVMKNGFRKLRRRWLISVLSVFLLFPLLLLTVMGINECRREGIAFTNLDDIVISQRFMSLINARRFEEAADLLDIESRYEDIQKVLALTPEDYLVPYELCMVDGEPWAAEKRFSNQYQLQHLCENWDGAYLWISLISDNAEGLIVPEAVWEQIRQTVEDDMENTEYVRLTQTYSPVDTPWGRFYASNPLVGELEKSELTAESLVALFNFVPYEIYQEAQEGLEQEAFERYQQTQEWYAFTADITQEEYVQSIKEQFVHALEACYSAGITLQNPHYSGAYRAGEQGWTIQISATQQYATGESYLVEYYFMIRNGKLHTVGSSYPVPIENDPVRNALWLHLSEP